MTAAAGVEASPVEVGDSVGDSFDTSQLNKCMNVPCQQLRISSLEHFFPAY